MQLHRGCVQGLKKPPLQFPFHQCHCLPHMDRDESSGKDTTLEKGLGVPLWQPPSPPADDPDDPAPLISHHTPHPYQYSWRDLQSLWSNWSAHKYLNVPVSIYLQLRSWKNIVKHEPSCESCFPLWQTGKCWLWSSLIPMDLSHLLSSLHRGPTKASGTVHRAPNKQQPGSSLQFSGSPAPFVRWYQLWYFKERCQKCKNEQLRINLLVGMGICLPLLIAL